MHASLAQLILQFGAACGLAAAFVVAGIPLCRKYAWVARPQPDRWHRGTPAKFGGVAIWLSVVAISAGFPGQSSHPLWALLGLASLMFLLGLIDDIVRLRPGPKLLAQSWIATLAAASGVAFPFDGKPLLTFAVAVLWIVGVTNAFNLLDNMDGLSAGVAVITALSLAVLCLQAGSPQYASFLVIVAGASAGFLLFNFHPARIFMGDNGSLFLGFLLASISLLESRHVSSVSALALAPMVVFAIPLLETCLVSITRRMRGQPISVGGTDHSSHRLVRLGLTERGAVLMIYLASFASGTVAILTRHQNHTHALGTAALWIFLLTLFGIHLFHMETRPEDHSHASRLLQRLLQHDRLAIVLDLIVLSLAYYIAYFVRFEAAVSYREWILFLHTWPLLIGAKWATMWACRVYRQSWWRGTAGDAYRLGTCAILGELSAIVVCGVCYGFTRFSRVVFVLDFVLSWGLLLLLRRSFALFRELICHLKDASAPAKRVFVLGTSEHSEVVLRFLQDQQIQCAGLIDTNGGADVRRHVWGVNVIGQVADLPRLATAHHVSEVVLPESESIPCSEMELINACAHERVRITKLGLHRLNADR